MGKNDQIVDAQRMRRRIIGEINTPGLSPFDFPIKDLRDIPGTRAHFEASPNGSRLTPEGQNGVGQGGERK